MPHHTSVASPLSSFAIRMPDDFHVHFRQGDALALYVQRSATWCGRAVVMPNTVPAIRVADDAVRYKADIENALQGMNENTTDAAHRFTPLMTCKLYSHHTPADIARMKECGVTACKLYPQGATTNSADGVSNPRALKDVYREIQTQDMALCVHGENPDVFVLERERSFLSTLSAIRDTAPDLRVVLEHVSSAEAVQYVREDTSGLLAATVTVHHLLHTLDDLIGEALNPHLFCKPVLKTPRDRHAIQSAVIDSDARFFLGTDSAPHGVNHKECAAGCAGVYSAPVAMPLLAGFFMDSGAGNFTPGDAVCALERFTSEFGARFYKLPLSEQTLTLKRSPWTVPQTIDGVVPLCAGKTLEWAVT